MKLLFATSNANKVISPKRVLAEYGIELEQVNLDLPELQAETVAAVAQAKAITAYDLLGGKPVMVIDSGFCIPALGRFPGPNVKWVTKQIGLDGYLRLLTTPSGWLSHNCWFEDVIAYTDGIMAKPKTFTRQVLGTLSRRIAPAYRADQKSELWRIFVPGGWTVPLAEMTDAQVAQVRSEPIHERFYHEFAAFLLGRDIPT